LAEKEQHPRVQLDARRRDLPAATRMLLPGRIVNSICSRFRATGVSTTQAATAVSSDSDDGEKEQLAEVFAHQSGAAGQAAGLGGEGMGFEWPYNSRKPRG
jgi:hypothetical protein